MNAWVGFDLDGTLAHYDGWVSVDHVGEPIPLMVETLRRELRDVGEVRIVTARAKDYGDGTHEHAIAAIEAWCLLHFGRTFAITNEKDFGMIRLYDDRCVQVETNTGRRIDGCAP